MINIKETKELFTNDKKIEAIDFLWGSPIIIDTEKITHVKIQITYNTSNIINKIDNETKFRKHRNFYYDNNLNSYIYEDDIIGINNFKRWLRSYGSSVIVLEPLSLAQDMYKSSLLTLTNYE